MKQGQHFLVTRLTETHQMPRRDRYFLGSEGFA